MSKFNYDKEAILLVEAIDIAIAEIKKCPPKDFNDTHLNHFVNGYMDFRKQALNPKPQYKNERSMIGLRIEVLTYFQEGKGEAVHNFWKAIKDRNLGFKRENQLSKILKRKKIMNQHEYDFVIDVLVPYQQEGILDNQELAEFNTMISNYKNK